MARPKSVRATWKFPRRALAFSDLPSTIFRPRPRTFLSRLTPSKRISFAQEILFDGVRRDKNVRGLGRKMVLGRSEKAKALLGNFQVARTDFGRAIGLCGGALRGAAWCGVTHNCCVAEGSVNPEKPISNREFFGKPRA